MSVPPPFEKMEPGLRELALAVHNRIEQLGPNLARNVKWGHAVLSGHKDIFAVMAAGKGTNAHVNLQVFHGASVSDPIRLLDGTGKSMRHIKFHSMPDLDRDGIDEVISAAIALDGEG